MYVLAHVRHMYMIIIREYTALPADPLDRMKYLLLP